jgi:hypothetical protein
MEDFERFRNKKFSEERDPENEINVKKITIMGLSFQCYANHRRTLMVGIALGWVIQWSLQSFEDDHRQRDSLDHWTVTRPSPNKCMFPPAHHRVRINQ